MCVLYGTAYYKFCNQNVAEKSVGLFPWQYCICLFNALNFNSSILFETFNMLAGLVKTFGIIQRVSFGQSTKNS